MGGIFLFCSLRSFDIEQTNRDKLYFQSTISFPPNMKRFSRGDEDKWPHY